MEVTILQMLRVLVEARGCYIVKIRSRCRKMFVSKMKFPVKKTMKVKTFWMFYMALSWLLSDVSKYRVAAARPSKLPPSQTNLRDTPIKP